MMGLADPLDVMTGVGLGNPTDLHGECAGVEDNFPRSAERISVCRHCPRYRRCCFRSRGHAPKTGADGEGVVGAGLYGNFLHDVVGAVL